MTIPGLQKGDGKANEGKKRSTDSTKCVPMIRVNVLNFCFWVTGIGFTFLPEST